MRNAIKVLLLGAAFALAFAALPAASVTAQDGGGIIIDSTFGGGITTLNNLYCSGTDCRALVRFLYPGIVSYNPETALPVPGGPGGLATEWTISDDLKVVTFKLRDDAKWNDGTPITTKDILYGWEVIKAPDSGAWRQWLPGLIEKVEAPDDYTLVVTMVNPDCTALDNAGGLPLVPSHVFGDTPFAGLKDHPYNTNPTVTWGPFKFADFRTGESAILLRDETYPDAIDGKVVPEGYLQKVVPDQTVQVEQFLAGEILVMEGVPVQRMADFRADANVQAYDFPGNSWDYLALNFADPTNPQPAFDADGNPIDQGKHPLFGDPLVRRAIALAIDVDSIMKGAVFGEGTRMAANMIPTSWAVHPTLQPLPYDPEQAKKLLEEAGWAPGADGILVKDGVRFSFTLLTNQGNTRREAIGTVVKDELAQLGIEVDFQTIDFNVLLDRMDSQTFDAFILGWRQGWPDDPDQTQLFLPESDIPGSGNNFTSYNNEEFNKLMKEALSVPGCGLEDRAKVYHRIQEIFQEDLPYVPLFVLNGMYAARSSIEGFDPFPNQMFWNVETWSVRTE